MKKFVKIFILMAVLVLSISLLFACNNDNSAKSTKFRYDSENDYYILTKYYGEDETYQVPSEYKGKTVGRIKADAFSGNDSIKTLVITDSVKVIDKGALANMKALVNITLPFIGNTPDAVAELNVSNKEQDISVDSARTFGYIFASSEYDGGATVSQGYSPSDSTNFYLPKDLKTVTVSPKDNYVIPAYAFSGNTLISKVILSNKITAIGEGAFKSCDSLNTIIIPKTVETIYKNAFYGCTSLSDYKTTTVNGQEKNIGFKIEDESALTLICDYAFSNTAIKTFVLPDGVISLGEYCFASVDNGTSKITSVVLGKGIKSIGNYAFYKSNIETVIIDSEAQDITIGKHAFNSCSNLKKFGSDTDKTIDLSKIKTEGGVKVIGTMAFANLLGEFTVIDNNVDTGNYVFDNTDIS